MSVLTRACAGPFLVTIKEATLEINDETCFDPKIVADYFNNFFTSIASNLVDKLPACFNLFHTESQTFQQYYISKIFRLMSLC